MCCVEGGGIFCYGKDMKYFMICYLELNQRIAYPSTCENEIGGRGSWETHCFR